MYYQIKTTRMVTILIEVMKNPILNTSHSDSGIPTIY